MIDEEAAERVRSPSGMGDGMRKLPSETEKEATPGSFRISARGYASIDAARSPIEADALRSSSRPGSTPPPRARTKRSRGLQRIHTWGEPRLWRRRCFPVASGRCEDSYRRNHRDFKSDNEEVGRENGPIAHINCAGEKDASREKPGWGEKGWRGT